MRLTLKNVYPSLSIELDTLPWNLFHSFVEKIKDSIFKFD